MVEKKTQKKKNDTKAEKSKRGRKCKYAEFVKPKVKSGEIKEWAEEGLIEAEMCKRLGVSRSQFQVYKKDFSDLSDSLKEGKQIADYRVEQSLFKRAMGYEYEESKVVWIGENKRRIEKTIKQVVSDVTAIIFWLKNRKPKDWKDKRDHDFTSGGEKVTINVNLTDNE